MFILIQVLANKLRIINELNGSYYILTLLKDFKREHSFLMVGHYIVIYNKNKHECIIEYLKRNILNENNI